jgi:hypothetical protein
MESKLTLKLDSGAIGRAKRYITLHRRYSLSKLVENYFNSLTRNQVEEDIKKLPPIVSGLAGISRKGKGKNATDEYTEYLMEKYR